MTTTDPVTDQTAIAELLRRVERLEAETEISQLFVRYAEALDYGDPQAWAACFTPDGHFDVRQRGEPLFAHTGTEELATFGAKHTHAPEVYHKHFVSIPNLTFDGPDHVTGSTYFTMLHERPEGPFVLVIGRYLDDLVRVDGRWALAERVVDMEALPPRAG